MRAMGPRAWRRWQFTARFRRHAFGWKLQPAITRIWEAVSEIRQVARTEPVDATEGAVALIERLSPALENIDSSSGAIGTAVNHAIAELVPIITDAPADERTRAVWLKRLFDAHAADQIPYSERLADCWGELCGSVNVASAWADRLIGVTRRPPRRRRAEASALLIVRSEVMANSIRAKTHDRRGWTRTETSSGALNLEVA